MRTVIGLFGDTREAKNTLDELEELGAQPRDISIVSREGTPSLGDITLKPVEVPGIGRLAASGPLVAYFDQHRAERQPDMLIDALAGMGLSREEASRYVEGVRNGYTLETVAVEDDKAEEALAIMTEHAVGRDTPRARNAGGATDRDLGRGGEAVLPLIAEELRVGKREVSAGGVRVTTHVTETPVEEDISLREETIDVQRRAADRPIGEGEEPFREQTIDVTAVTEEPVIEKHARVVEEVVVRKDEATRTEKVRDTVRKTEADVENLEGFRQHFQSRYGSEGASFDEYAPAYRFGSNMRGDGHSFDRDWSRVEPSARSSWERKSPGTWERFKDAIKHAFER